MADFQRPIDAVEAAMPGSLEDLIERTGFAAGLILSLITRLRVEGKRVNVTPDVVAGTTIYGVETVASVDSGSGKE